MKSDKLTSRGILSAPIGPQILGRTFEDSQRDLEAQSPKQTTAGPHAFSEFIDFGGSLDSFDQFDSSLTNPDTSQTKTIPFTTSLTEDSSRARSVLDHNNSSSWWTSQNNPVADQNGFGIAFADDEFDTRLHVDFPADKAVTLDNRFLPGGWSSEHSDEAARIDQRNLTGSNIETGLDISWDLFDELSVDRINFHDIC